MAGNNNNSSTNTMQNWHGDNTPMAPPHILDWLSNLYQQAQNANTGNGQDQSQDQQSNLPPAHQAAIDGAIQGIKKSASEAASMGGLDAANHIINQATMGTSGTASPTDPQKMALLQTLVQSAGQNQGQGQAQSQPAQSQPSQQPAQISSNNDNTDPISTFLGMFGIKPTPDNQLMLAQTQALKQKIAAGQPAEIAVPLAQAAELNQKISGAEPIQPKDIADLNRQTYAATIQAANDAWQRNTDEIKTMQEQYKNLQENRGPLGKFEGTSSPEMKQMQTLIVAKMKQNQQHLANLHTILVNPPKAINENPSSVNNSPFQVGQQYNGETIKNVKRIK